MGEQNKMKYNALNESKIVKPEFQHYKEAKPEVITITKMSYDEWNGLELYKKVHINEFYEILNSIDFNPKYVLEWGSGLSTYLLSDFCFRWGSNLFLTIDHDKKYQSQILAKLQKSETTEVCSMDLIGAIWPWDEDIYNYATYPMSKNIKYDFIFVDGRRRNECMLAASRVLSRSGIVIVHDVWRKRYALGLGLFREIKRFDEYFILGSSHVNHNN
jgi:predicted O-methyltransferase YrrM